MPDAIADAIAHTEPDPLAVAIRQRLAHACQHAFAHAFPLADTHPEPEPDTCSDPHCHSDAAGSTCWGRHRA